VSRVAALSARAGLSEPTKHCITPKAQDDSIRLRFPLCVSPAVGHGTPCLFRMGSGVNPDVSRKVAQGSVDYRSP
jgi:hypothetical protein